MAYNIYMENAQKIQVYRQIGEHDKIVYKAFEIQKSFEVLSYSEVEKRLDTKINYPVLAEKYKKGRI